MLFLNDLKTALRSLSNAKGLTITVVLTLALGIGANAAIFTLVRGVLLRPLVNRDENRLIYIRQNAPGLNADNTTFSVPEIQDLRNSIKSVKEFGDFSEFGFTMVGLGEPRGVKAGAMTAPTLLAPRCSRIASGARYLRRTPRLSVRAFAWKA